MPNFTFEPYSGGPIINSLRGVKYTIAGSDIRTPGAYTSTDNQSPTTHECVHPMMKYFKASRAYTTIAFKDLKRRYTGEGRGSCWEGTYSIPRTLPLTRRLRRSPGDIWSLIREILKAYKLHL
jgi:hypothetical protein